MMMTAFEYSHHNSPKKQLKNIEELISQNNNDNNKELNDNEYYRAPLSSNNLIDNSIDQTLIINEIFDDKENIVPQNLFETPLSHEIQHPSSIIIKSIAKMKESLPRLNDWLQKLSPHKLTRIYQKRFVYVKDSHLIWNHKRVEINWELFIYIYQSFFYYIK